MRETEYAFAVAKIRANEVDLLTAADLEGLIAAADYEAAVKQLAELGFLENTNEDPEMALRQKEQQAFALICEIAPDQNLFDFLVVKNDFHNIKAVLKAMVADTEYAPFVLSPYLISPDAIHRAVGERREADLPDWAATAVKEGYDLVSSTMDGQQLDLFLDRLYLQTAQKLAAQSKEPFSVRLVEQMTAIADLQIVVRAAEMGKDAEVIRAALVPCQTFDLDRLIGAALKGKEDLADYLAESGLEAVAEGLQGSLVAFERALDDSLMECVRSARYQSFGIAPLIGYYLARVSESKTVRIILCCKRGGLPEQEIRERVRKLYV